ncbi:MAG: 4Fe-4S binding protein [Chloroflexi bacterium]|nr:4Fe-4S binding protein [Chloroflexota bacterium]
MPPVIDLEKCNLCGVCEEVCPGDILYMEGGKQRIVRYPQECDQCGICALDCPEKAIEIIFPLDLLTTPPTTDLGQIIKRSSK